jgi:DNA-binding MarR family transcriptional regulator
MTRRRRPALPSRLAGPQDSPGFLLWKVSNAWQRRQRQALKPFGLTHAQFVLLAVATWFGSEEALTQVRLSSLSGVDVMTTSQIVRTLAGAGLMARAQHPNDPRANTLIVTAAGKAKVRKAIVAVERTDEEFFAPVSAQSAQLLRALTRLAAPDSV